MNNQGDPRTKRFSCLAQHMPPHPAHSYIMCRLNIRVLTDMAMQAGL